MVRKKLHTFRKNRSEDQKKELALTLLQRKPHDEYTKEWTEALKKYQEQPIKEGTLSVVVFRIGSEWLALPTIYFKEVIQSRTIHRVPHHTSGVLLGVVNLNGELQLCVSLKFLLEIQTEDHSSKDHLNYARMIAIAKEGELWVFPVDEIDSIYLWDLSALEKIPSNLSKSKINYFKGMMQSNGRYHGLLDEELLFFSLKRKLL